MGGVAISSEADFPSCEAIHPLQNRVSARLPRFPDSQWGLAFIHVARALNAVFSVFFVSTVSAIAADKAIQAGSDRGNGIHGFYQNPNLDHVACFPVVRGFIEAGGNDDPLGVFMDDVAVAHREPPISNCAKQ